MATDRPILFLLHALGASAREWAEVVQHLGDGYDCRPVDLAGFGDAAADPDTDVADMVDRLADMIRAADPAAYLLVGHSMGGKLATLLAARAEAGEVGLSSLAGVVLLAGSPPVPEPMAEDRRAAMLGWAANGAISADHAREFIAANSAGDLPDALMERAVADVCRSAPHAWVAWLARGSREDWQARVGTLATPALLIVGGEDEDLGEANQRRLNLPHYRRGRVAVVADAAHLLPYEQPAAVARLIDDFWHEVADRLPPAAYARLLASNRVSARTRATLLARLDDPAAGAPGCLGETRLALLRALVARILPGAGAGLDLAGRLDETLASGQGDGWRFAQLPADREAWQAGLDSLAEAAPGFAALAPAEQDGWLQRMAAGEVGTEAPGRLSPAQMRLWFEDVRAEAVRTWLAHPTSMARIGYDGFATGGDGARLQGFRRTGADEPNPWEPAAVGAAA